MGKQARKRKTKRVKRDASSLPPTRHGALSILIPKLTVAKGHDGFMRGSPEPTLLVGAFLNDAGGATERTLVRGLWRFASPRSMPSDVATAGEHQVRTDIFVTRPASIVLLAVAFEEDAGRDVAEVFSAMETAARLHVWREDEPAPHPLNLAELWLGNADLGPAAFDHPTRVNVHLDGKDLKRNCKSDDYVDALAVVLSANRTHRRDLRFHFRTHDGRNDWTAVMEIRI